MNIRQAKPSDLDGVVALGLEALRNDPYEGLVISEQRCREVARNAISSPSDFCWVCEADDGEIVGSVMAIVTPIMFYERKQATVVQFYCKAPGYGVKLLRQLLAWCRGRRIIRMVVFTLEVRADPRIGKLLRRLGLTSELPVYMKIL